MKWSESCSVVSASLRLHGLCSPCNSPGQNTRVGSLSLLQGIVPIQGSNPGLPHCRQILYQLSHKGSPGILEWVAYPFSRGSSWPRNWTRVTCIATDSLPTELWEKLPHNAERQRANRQLVRGGAWCMDLIFVVWSLLSASFLFSFPNACKN